MSDVRVEVIVNGLKELQGEKARLEHKLGELRRQRSVLEKNVEVLTSRRTQSKDVNAKMKETLHVAQSKVSQTQAQLDVLQKLMGDKREKNHDLSKQVDELKKQQLEETRMFEKGLVKLTEMFLEAKKFYDENSLEHKIGETMETIQSIKKSTDEKEKDVADLTETFNKLAVEYESKEEKLRNMLFSATEQESIHAVFAHERDAAKSALAELSKKKGQMEKDFQSLNSQS